jgi:hypothetical protein
MTFTNYGNGYKFQALMERRSSKNTVLLQRMKKDGTWGKPLETRVFGNETPERVLARIQGNNPNNVYRLAQ